MTLIQKIFFGFIFATYVTSSQTVALEPAEGDKHDALPPLPVPQPQPVQEDWRAHLERNKDACESAIKAVERTLGIKKPPAPGEPIPASVQ